MYCKRDEIGDATNHKHWIYIFRLEKVQLVFFLYFWLKQIWVIVKTWVIMRNNILWLTEWKKTDRALAIWNECTDFPGAVAPFAFRCCAVSFRKWRTEQREKNSFKWNAALKIYTLLIAFYCRYGFIYSLFYNLSPPILIECLSVITNVLLRPKTSAEKKAFRLNLKHLHFIIITWRRQKRDRERVKAIKNFA